jgi:hypothetical protein
VLASPRAIQEMRGGRQFEFHRVDPKDPDIEYLRAYYGLSADFPYEQLICQNMQMNKLYFVSKQVSDFLYADPSHQLSLIHLGI